MGIPENFFRDTFQDFKDFCLRLIKSKFNNLLQSSSSMHSHNDPFILTLFNEGDLVLDSSHFE